MKPSVQSSLFIQKPSTMFHYLLFSLLSRPDWCHKGPRLWWDLWRRHEWGSHIRSQQPWRKSCFYEVCWKHYAEINVQYHTSSAVWKCFYIWSSLLAYKCYKMYSGLSWYLYLPEVTAKIVSPEKGYSKTLWEEKRNQKRDRIPKVNMFSDSIFIEFKKEDESSIFK